MKKALEYSKILENVGLTREQAEAHLNVLEQIMHEDVATKSDILNMKSELKAEIIILEHKITTKLGVIVTTAMAGLATFFKFFI